MTSPYPLTSNAYYIGAPIPPRLGPSWSEPGLCDPPPRVRGFHRDRLAVLARPVVLSVPLANSGRTSPPRGSPNSLVSAPLPGRLPANSSPQLGLGRLKGQFAANPRRVCFLLSAVAALPVPPRNFPGLARLSYSEKGQERAESRRTRYNSFCRGPRYFPPGRAPGERQFPPALSFLPRRVRPVNENSGKLIGSGERHTETDWRPATRFI